MNYVKKKEESIYTTWPKERNTWAPPKPELPPELPPPYVNRFSKPGNNTILKEGYIEVNY